MSEKLHKSNIHPKFIEPLLAEAIRFRDKGKTWNEILPEVVNYWDHKPPVNGASLSSYVSGIATRKSCPPFFKEWWGKRNVKSKTPAKKIATTKKIKGCRPERMVPESSVRIRERGASLQLAEEMQDILSRLHSLAEVVHVSPEFIISTLEKHLSDRIH